MGTDWKRRSESDSNPTLVMEVGWHKPKYGSATISYQIQRSQAMDERNFTGWDIPNFHARRRRGELMPMTPFIKFRSTGSAGGNYDVTHTDGSRNYNAPGNWMGHEADWYLFENYVRSFCSSASLVYVQEAAAKIYGSGHDTLTFLAELADVRRLFLSTGRKLIKLDIPKNWRNLSSDWLATRYGWRTLLYDLQDLNKAIKSLHAKRTRYSERAGNTYSTTQTSEYTFSMTSGVYRGDIVDKATIGERGSVVADVDVPQFQINPLVTGWELIPFSFVFDWFVSVGKALAAWSFLSLSPTYVAATGLSIKVSRTLTGYPLSFSSTYKSGTWARWATAEAELLIRTPCTIPLLPRFNLRLNPMKVLDLLALIVQRWR